MRGFCDEEGFRMVESEVSALNQCWGRAWLEKDEATVDHLMAADYIYIAPRAVVLDRQAIMAVIRSPAYRLEHGSRTEVVIRPLGRDAAIVRQRCQSAGSFEGAPFAEDFRCVMICERQNGEWRIVL